MYDVGPSRRAGEVVALALRARAAPDNRTRISSPSGCSPPRYVFMKTTTPVRSTGR